MQQQIPKPVRARWAGVVVTAAVLAFAWLIVPEAGMQLDTLLYDRIQRADGPVVDTPITVIAIDGPSTARIGPWPWPEAVMARLIEELKATGPAAIAIATPIFTSPGSASPEQDVHPLARLSTVDAYRGLVVAIEGADPADADSRQPGALPNGTAVLPPGVIAGHSVLHTDADGIVRSLPAEIEWQDRAVPALPLAIAATALGVAVSDRASASPERFASGALEVPLDSGMLRPRFLVEGARGLRELPAWQVLASEASEQDLKDHVVIVGHAGERVATPVAHSQPLAHVVAAAVASVLEQQVIARPGWARALEWLAAVLVIAFAGFVIPKLGPWTSLAATAIVAVSCIAVALFALAFADVWIALAVPAAAVLTGWGAAQAAFLDVTRSPATPQVTMATGAPLQTESVLQLAQTFRSQGRLELAFEALRQCAGEARILDALYELGVEFECSGDTARAATVFAHIANVDPAFRDASARIAVAHGLPTHGVSGAAESRPEAPLPLLPTDPAEVALDVQRLGRYEIESEIGKGAMGVVYLGRDPRINRVVAIKAIALADEFEEADLAEAKARFFREAEMAGRLNHPGIVTIYDVGESGRLAFIAMELLRGRHLSHYAESANLLPPEQVLELVARVAEALHYAHRQNVVHRDIKPANIMFDPDTDELKITDFGIARLTDTSRTKTGIVLGTPSFMSPEQLEGRRLDGRSDLFSLGVSLYQLLTGQLPFRAESMTRLMQKIATETHDPLRAVRPELPDSVERVVARALAKNPDDRFQTGAELAAALRDCAARLAA